MRFRVTLLVAALAFAGCGPSALELMKPPHFASSLSRSPYPKLKNALDALVPDSLFPPSNVGINVVSLRTKETLYALNPTALFNPASNQKLFTGSTALAMLGPSFTLSTIVSIDTASSTLCVRGQGDPLMTTHDIDSLARLVAPLIPTGVGWHLVGDVSYFDDLYWGDGWTWDGEPADYAMFISPLIVNSNAVHVEVSPGIAPGDSTFVIVTPPSAMFPVENRGRTTADTALAPLRISRKWRERSNVLTVDGEIKLGARFQSEDLSVWQPERYFVSLFADKLRSLGVVIADTTIERTPRNGTVMYRYGHNLDTALTFIEKVSDNLGAESLLRILAAEKVGTPGSAEIGVHVVNYFLSRAGIDTSDIAIADGSGLSRYDLTSTESITRLLTVMHADTASFPTLFHALPIAGVDGTIGRRMRGSRAEANLRAKTGSLSAVTALSGFVTTADGEPLAFSILMQSFPGSSRDYRLVQDRIGAYLAGLKTEMFR
jgi:serine-type D-Ala-D-Ala carboxypeptidase/endopeptidase (penicillin-binding protein 4)